MKAEDYEKKYNRFMRLENLKFLVSIALGFICLFSLGFCMAFVLYFFFVDVILFSIAVCEFPDVAAFLISPVCRCVVCSIAAVFAILTPKEW